jgi:hypothetical protein
VSGPIRLLCLAGVVGLALTISACGSSSSSGSATGAAGAQGPGRLFTAKIRTCLKKQGVTLPSFSGNRRRPGAGTAGAPPAGTRRPPNGARRGRFAGSAKLRAAMKACGVTFPGRGPGAPGASQGQTVPQS